jgi:large subunit ribosomal protein L10
MKSKLVRELNRLVKAYSAEEEKEEKVRRAIEEKRKVVEEAKKLLSLYRTLLLLDASNIPSNYVTILRKHLEGIGVVRLFKNNLLKLAMKELSMKNLDEFSKYLQGTNIATFMNLNPFEAKMLLDRIKVPWRAKPGDKVEHEIVVSPMKTDVKPGPMMSLFSKLKVPIQVRDGVIWIAKEATIARPGDVVTPELASLFDRLGVEPKILKPIIKVAYERGVIIPGDSLTLDLEMYRKEFTEAVLKAVNIASELAIPDPMVLKSSLLKAYTRALRVAAEAGVLTKETSTMVLVSAVSRAYALALMLIAKSPEVAQYLQIAMPIAMAPTTTEQQTTQKAEERKEEEEKKEGVSEEQLAEGLVALFG